jgi:ATP-dependent Zn protease
VTSNGSPNGEYPVGPFPNGQVFEARVHVAEEDDREPHKRRPMVFFDRIKVLVIIALIILLTTMYEAQQIPLLSFGDALRDQLRAKWWLLIIAGLEVLRQIHYVISEHSESWHMFWDRKVFGGWERFMSKRNPWQRFRMQRLVKWLAFFVIAVLLLSWKWSLSPLEALAYAPGRIFGNLFGPPTSNFPLAISLILNMTFSLFYLVFFFGIFFIGGIDHFKPGEIKTRFRDIWGQDHVKEKVAENLDFLNRPAEIEARGGYVPGGLLLWGPPGTGKTLMAEAMAGETGKPFFFVDPSAFVQTFLGVAPMKMKWLYRRLRKSALRNGGVVVFFDEADVLGNRGQLPDDWDRMTDGLQDLRWLSPAGQQAVLGSLAPRPNASDGPEAPRRLRDRIIMPGMNAGGMGTLQAILTEMSGLNKPRGFFSKRIRSFLNIKPKAAPKYRILHVFATNQPNALDQALLRPGRIDRIYKVGYPSKEGRVKTYEGYFRKITHEITPEQIDRLATITPYATGASIKDIVNESVIVAMKRGSDTVTWQDVLIAKRDKELGPPENVDYIERERHAIAIHEACHAIAAYRTRQDWMIDLATIEKGGTYLGMVSSVKAEDQYTRWKSEYESDIMVSLASLAGERMFFDDDNSSGVSGDLNSATAIAALMESTWGMGQTITSQGTIQKILGGVGGGGAPKPKEGEGNDDKKQPDGGLGQRIEGRLQDLYERTQQLLQTNRLEVLALAHALETHKTISGEDVTAIIEGTVGPTVDGRVYRSEHFRTLAESYHTVARQAHKEHAKVEVALPTLVSGGLIPPPPPVPIGALPGAATAPPHTNGGPSA